MKPYWVVRKAGLPDLSRILEIDGLSDPLSWTGDAYRAYLSNFPDTAALVVLPAELRGDVMGFAIARKVGDEMEILKIAVHPGSQRQGLASLLMAGLLDIARTWKAPSWILEVRESNIAALALYRKFGFQISGIRAGYYADRGENALLMRALLEDFCIDD